MCELVERPLGKSAASSDAKIKRRIYEAASAFELPIAFVSKL